MVAVSRSREQRHKLTRVFDQHAKKVVVYKPREEQAKLDAMSETCRSLLVLKPRRIGVSLWCTIRMFWEWYFATTPERFLVGAHLDETVKDTMQRDANSFRALYDRLPKIMQRPLKVNNDHNLIFADTGAAIQGFSERSEAARSKGCSGAWLQEYAYYTRQSEFFASIDATIAEAGWTTLETTVNVPGDDYHRRVLQAEAGDSDFELAAFFWFEHPRHRLKRKSIPEEGWTQEERRLAERVSKEYGVDLDGHQVAWWRWKRSRLGAKFPKEYPSSVADAFRVVDGVYLAPHLFDRIQSVPLIGNSLELEEPVTGDLYAHGVDVGGGVGQDYTSHTVFSLTTGQPVYAWSSNRTPPAMAAERVFEEWKRYPGVLLVESNNHGHLVVYRLRELGVPDITRSNFVGLWVDSLGRDWVTTKPSKLLAFDNLQAELELGLIEKLPSIHLLELQALVCPKVTPEAPSGQHDDHAMSVALGRMALKKIPRSALEWAQRAKSQTKLQQLVACRRRRQGLPWTH